MFVINFLTGILIIAAGVVALKFNFKLVGLFGRSTSVENKLGSGSTYALFQFLAMAIIAIGFLTMFSLHDNVLEFIFSPLIDVFGSNS